jgi:hypothetical protein
MRTATGPSSHQAMLSTERSEHRLGVGDDVGNVAAGLSG